MAIFPGWEAPRTCPVSRQRAVPSGANEDERVEFEGEKSWNYFQGMHIWRRPFKSWVNHKLLHWVLRVVLIGVAWKQFQTGWRNYLIDWITFSCVLVDTPPWRRSSMWRPCSKMDNNWPCTIFHMDIWYVMFVLKIPPLYLRGLSGVVVTVWTGCKIDFPEYVFHLRSCFCKYELTRWIALVARRSIKTWISQEPNVFIQNHREICSSVRRPSHYTSGFPERRYRQICEEFYTPQNWNTAAMELTL